MKLPLLSPREIALRRQGEAYSLSLVDSLSPLIPSFIDAATKSSLNPPSPLLSTITAVTKNLLSVLYKIQHESSTSPELTFELAADGLHVLCTRLTKVCSLLEDELGRDEDAEEEISRTLSPIDPTFSYTKLVDVAIDVNEAVFNIAAVATQCNVKFPSPLSPLTSEERQARAPMTFEFYSSPIHPPLLISQVSNVRQNSQDDVGFVMWPSAVLLAAFCLNSPQIFRSKSVLELGAGCGLTGQAVGRVVGGGGSVTLTDFNPTIIENLRRNVEINEMSDVVLAKRLDFYEQSGESSDGWIDGGIKYEQVDVVIAADVVCKDEDAVACSKAIFDALKSGGVAHVISGTGKHRYGVDIFQSECIKRGLKCESSVVTAAEILDDGDALAMGLKGLEQCAGWVPNMTFWKHVITK